MHLQAYIAFKYVHVCLCKNCDAMVYIKKGWPSGLICPFRIMWELRSFDTLHMQNLFPHTFPFTTLLATCSSQPCCEKIRSVSLLGFCHRASSVLNIPQPAAAGSWSALSRLWGLKNDDLNLGWDKG